MTLPERFVSPFHEFLEGRKNPEDHPDTINPSIFHQAVMNYQAQGLYKVVDGVYQLRGNEICQYHDLPNEERLRAQ